VFVRGVSTPIQTISGPNLLATLEHPTMKAIPTVQLENERVIVTEWRFAPGAETEYHVHAHDYVVVPMTDGALRLEEPEGTRDVELKAGVSYARGAGVAHNVVNINAHEFSFIEIELK
jgi:quercetin dioxygenase-like cupin family protein